MVKNTVHRRAQSQSVQGEGETYEHLNMMRKAKEFCSTEKPYWIIGKRKQKEQKVSTVSGNEERVGYQTNIIRQSVLAELGNKSAAQNQDGFV